MLFESILLNISGSSGISFLGELLELIWCMVEIQRAYNVLIQSTDNNNWYNCCNTMEIGYMRNINH